MFGCCGVAGLLEARGGSSRQNTQLGILYLGSILNQGPFLGGPQYSTAPSNERTPKRDPNLENYSLFYGHMKTRESIPCVGSFRGSGPGVLLTLLILGVRHKSRFSTFLG